MENYKKDFIRSLKIIWENLLQRGELDIPQDNENKNEHELIILYGEIFRKYLNIEVSSIEKIFRKKFGEELINYFINYYEPEKFFIFIAFIIYLVLEEDFDLLPMRSELTGKVCGVWKIGEINTGIDELSKLIEREIQYSLAKENYAEFYYSQYKALSNPFMKKLVSESYLKVKEEKLLPEDKEKEEAKTLLEKLVGVTTATIILTLLGRWIGKKLRMLKVWVSSDPSVQSMFSIGCAAGSLKFFGFCMERSKDPPTKNSYQVTYKTGLPCELQEVYDRIPLYLEFFKRFANITDNRILRILDSEKGKEKTWWTLQQFFWLITQPYCDNEKEGIKVWEELIPQIDYGALIEFNFSRTGPLIFFASIPQIDYGAFIESEKSLGLETERKIDYEKVKLVQKAIEILRTYNIEVHPENREILLNLKQKAKRIIDVE